ncbi:ABC transporter substrate-binding protein [Mesorhizobium sp.]|uniref:ABC transporter substrate-binding protein n=1 Tax=Mesorhizobium sp. TaxID=1871066 RepID=UPI000FE9952C|nr:ABC transporter substrate-binding protein [Mesorhizobium sp.]RWB00196.1 MAG: ABC transporter substrate-binding protein [Mesorhizobium sp.]RWO98805.1 MAG: ABC transporter substrate-binding protein [Mesorhizobium sp.]RWP14188.1 MAG: ABC transporter substrate-binding protein [Mesorhizobium sp.]RWQ26484.1 MAG: ABC transporter substrate-binding protein [Mesorhizobium sp.]RWQ45427.1 MAG: ABC transporter substrate-binding protein [Mesorhizobium sp.]
MKRLALSFASLLLAQTAFAFPVTVDSCGTPLTFDAAPKRAVIQDMNMAEMAFALGHQPSIVGLTGITGWYKVGPEFKAGQGAIPELAPKYPTLENLVAVEPDFFFAGWYYGEVTPDTLAPHGIKTLVLTESCVHLDNNRPAASMDLLYGDIEKLGRIFGKQARAEKLVSGWKAQLAAITAKVGDREGTRVFLYDSGEDKPFTSGKFAIPSAMIAAAGGDNIMADMQTSWGNTDWETVASRNPQFLILLDYQDGGGYRKLLDFLKVHPAMKETDAVRNERFVALRYAELTPGPANIEAIGKIASAMHPEAF